MARLILLIACIFGVYLKSSTSTSITCSYDETTRNIVQDSYYCSLSLDIGITNIKAIKVDDCKLKEITQADLKPFPKLVEISISSNALEVLEEGLFEFNPDLEYIYFYTNKIIHIEPNIFEHLSKLRYLYLGSNYCISKSAKNSKSLVKKLIRLTEIQCINSDFSSLNSQLDALKNVSVTLNPEEFREKLLAFEKTFNSSKFANYRPLNYKFDALKNPKIENLDTFEAPQNSSSTCLNDSTLDQITSNINDLKTFQNSSMDSLKSTLDEVKTALNLACTSESLNKVLSIQSNLLGLQSEISTQIRDSQIIVKASLDTLTSTFNLITADLSMTVSKIDAKIDNLESRLNSNSAVSQNEDNFKIFGDKLEALQADNVQKYDKIEKELMNMRIEIEAAIDGKIKGIEERLISKFEEVLVEKLRKFLS
ncbi:hypothetical protein ACKWTF_014641 [Chironomus riparius]